MSGRRVFVGFTVLLLALWGCEPKSAAPAAEAEEEVAPAVEEPAQPDTAEEAEPEAIEEAEPAAEAPVEEKAEEPQDKLPEATVPVPAGEITIDGKLDEESWKKAPVLGTAYLWGGTETPKQKTEIRVLADKQAYYVAFTCSESHMSELLAQKTDRDSNVWEDDVIEFFLLPGRTPSNNYYHVLVNAAGTVADEFSRDMSAWDAKGIQAAVQKAEDHWVAEVKLPWSDIPVGGKPLPAEWRANFNRTRPAKGTSYFEDQAWSPTLLDTSHVPERFGYLKIEAFEARE